MKTLLFEFSFGLTSIISFGQSIIYDTIQYAKEYHQKRLTLFNGEPIIKGKTIFLGNSITEFGDWKKLLNDQSVINRGIAGDNTFGVLARLEDVIIRQPSKLFIKIGINDISQDIPVEIMVKNILAILERVQAKSPTTKIYVHSILPTNDNVKKEYPEAFNKNDRVRTVNGKISQKAKTNKFIYIDLDKEFKDNEGKLNVKYAESDGLHLNEVGYQTWIRLLKANGYL